MDQKKNIIISNIKFSSFDTHAAADGDGEEIMCKCTSLVGCRQRSVLDRLQTNGTDTCWIEKKNH